MPTFHRNPSHHCALFTAFIGVCFTLTGCGLPPRWQKVVDAKRKDAGTEFAKFATRYNPGDPDGYYLRGMNNFEQKQYQKAIDDFTTAINMKLPPTESVFVDQIFNMSGVNRRGTYYLGRAEVYFTIKEYKKAIGDYDEAIKLNPKLAWPYGYRGLAHDHLGDFDLPMNDFNQALSLGFKAAWIYAWRGTIWEQKGNHDNALADYATAIQLDSAAPWSYVSRAYTYTKLKQWKLALADCNRAIELNPKFAAAYTQRSEVYTALGKEDLAVQDEEAAKRLKPYSQED